jgi:hypothetical protein
MEYNGDRRMAESDISSGKTAFTTLRDGTSLSVVVTNRW